MGQSSLKSNRRALRKTAREEKNSIVTRYMTQNWDKVLVSAVSFIRRLNFKTRFQIAILILFKPARKPKGGEIAEPGAALAGTVPSPAKPKASGKV